jgi:hypothetical protein
MEAWVGAMWRASSAGGYPLKMPHPTNAFNTIFCGYCTSKPHPLVDKSRKWHINNGFTDIARQTRKDRQNVGRDTG